MKTIFAAGSAKEVAREFSADDVAIMTGIIETAIKLNMTAAEAMVAFSVIAENGKDPNGMKAFGDLHRQRVAEGLDEPLALEDFLPVDPSMKGPDDMERARAEMDMLENGAPTENMAAVLAAKLRQVLQP